MTINQIDDAISEAKRFLAKAVKVKKEHDDPGDRNVTLWGSKHTGALRRASMDLTRALAKMRRGYE